MKTMLHEHIGHIPPAGFAVFVGTSGHKKGIAVRKIEHAYNLTSPEDRLPILGIDAAGITTSFRVHMVDSSLDDVGLGPNEFLAAGLPDCESLQKAEREGKLWRMEPGWHKEPGVIKDDQGTGGNSRKGHGLGALNENRIHKKVRRNIRDCGDYQHQRLLMDKGSNKGAKGMAITVVVCLSLLGGCATGMLRTLLRIIREESLDLKVPVKIIVLAMVKGSIEPADGEVAARNQSMALRELNAALVGGYKDADYDPRINQPLCDSLLLISNRNNWGEFNDLDRLIAVAGQYIFYLFHTALGRAILEKAVDIEECWPDDDLGGRRCVSTMGISKIHLDLPRAIAGTAHMLLHESLQWLMLNRPEPGAAKEANLLSMEKELAETETTSLASQRLHRLTDYRRADARDYAIAAFQQRCGQRWGFKHCCDLDSASAYALDIEVPRRLKPQVHREGERFISELSAAVENKVRSLLAGSDGIRMTRQFLDALTVELAKFTSANRRKLEVAQSKKKSIDDLLGRAHEMLDRLKKRFWLFRALSFSTKREISRIIPPATESAIRNRLEIAARLSLANEVYPAVRKYVSQQQACVHQLVNNVTAVMTDVGCEADRLRKAEPVLLVPLGHEVVNETFIDGRHAKIVDAEGGLEQVFEKVFAEFIGHYKNLLAFNYIELGQIKETLLEYCLGISHRHLGTLRVGDVFRESCKSPQEIKDRIDQSIRESQGRLRLVGEADEVIPTMKFIAVGDRATGEWIAREANGIDTTSGDWQPVEIDDPNSIVFYQQRSRISLMRIIADTDSQWTMPASLRERAKLGSDPVLALAPQPDCSTEEILALITMGLATGVLYRSAAGYELDGQPGDTIPLGTDLDEVIRNLRKDYARLIRLYCPFTMRLGDDYDNLMNRLKRPAKSRGQEPEALLPGVGMDAPLAQVHEVAAALMPYLRRRPGGRRTVARPAEQDDRQSGESQ
jgi:hypothetical protein